MFDHGSPMFSLVCAMSYDQRAPVYPKAFGYVSNVLSPFFIDPETGFLESGLSGLPVHGHRCYVAP